MSQACNFIEKETLAQVFSCEFREIFKDFFFYRTPLDDYFYLLLKLLEWLILLQSNYQPDRFVSFRR